MNEESFSLTRAGHGGPQGSVIEPALFSALMLPPATIIKQHDINFTMQMIPSCTYP